MAEATTTAATATAEKPGEGMKIHMSKTTAEMHEGPEALERFRKALKTIVNAPKSVVTKDREQAAAKKKKRAAKRP